MDDVEKKVIGRDERMKDARDQCRRYRTRRCGLDRRMVRDGLVRGLCPADLMTCLMVADQCLALAGEMDVVLVYCVHRAAKFA